MAHSSSIIDSLGEEIVRIITPVSICMFLVVILVSILNTNSSSSFSVSSIATIAYSESTSDSIWDKFIVLLFYFRCTRFLKLYMAFSAFVVLGFLGGQISLFLIQHFDTPIDSITFLIALFNFSVVGVVAVFMSKMPIIVTQGYLVVIGILVAYWFTMLPEWTTWSMLVAMALYDLAAVLLPVGPLRLLVELAISRDEEIPALVYEARPVNHHSFHARTDAVTQRRMWRDRRIDDHDDDSNLNVNSVFAHGHGLNHEFNSNMDEENVLTSNSNTNHLDRIHGDINLARENASSNSNLNSNSFYDRNLVTVEEGQVQETNADISTPLIDHGVTVRLHGVEDSASSENLMLEGIGLGSSGAIKLGLGDFIFYSVLVGRAAMYDFMTVYACYLAIIAGLGVTLILLAVYRKALPALPVSVALGVLFYLLTRLLLEVFVVQCSLNLLMF
ncbi:putative presenilin/signal peptide peptidase [Lupinus albus]|uniref:Presenilin n=1 Tax=Lupinus albus TaxID=3870 RepID=A0A6A4PL28_LUPAL|nr:putative presenilin/signal peptide peptidase [Lupinus albus]